MPAKKNSGKSRKPQTNLTRALVLLIVLAFFAAVYSANPDIRLPDGRLLQQVLLSGEYPPAPTAPPVVSSGQPLRAYVLDVDQGDSILLISPAGRTMLVDAGERSSFDNIAAVLSDLDITRLDALVATHPHSDHIGGMADIINTYEVGRMYLPAEDGVSATFERMMQALEDHGVETIRVSADETPTLQWDDSVTVDVLSPFSDVAYSDYNDYSIIMRVRYGSTAIMLTGDAEGGGDETAEYIALARLGSSCFDSTVLKVGHHGSFTSTSPAFLDAVDPELAIISCGVDNEYGHPHESTLNLLNDRGIAIHRTDTGGHILVEMDGVKATATALGKQPSE